MIYIFPFYKIKFSLKKYNFTNMCYAAIQSKIVTCITFIFLT